MAWTLDGSGAGVGTFTGSGAGPTTLGMGFSAGGSNNDHYWFVGWSMMRMAEGSNDERVLNMGVTDDSTTQQLTEILRFRQTITGFSEQVIIQVWGARNSDFSTKVLVETTVGLTCTVSYKNVGNKTVLFDCLMFLNTAAPTGGNFEDFIEGGICERDGASSASMTTTHIEALGVVDFVMSAAHIVDISPQPISGYTMDTDLDTNTTAITGALQIKTFSRAAATTGANTLINKAETGNETNTCMWALRFSTVSLATFPSFGTASLINADGNTAADCTPSLLGPTATRSRRKGRKIYAIFE